MMQKITPRRRICGKVISKKDDGAVQGIAVFLLAGSYCHGRRGGRVRWVGCRDFGKNIMAPLASGLRKKDGRENQDRRSGATRGIVDVLQLESRFGRHLPNALRGRGAWG